MLQRVRRKVRETTREAIDISRRFRLRRTPSGARYAIADSVTMLNAAHWDTLTSSASVFMSRRYLEVLELNRPEGLRSHLGLVYLDRRPVAAIAAQSLHLSRDSIPAPDEDQRKRDRALWRALAGIDQRVLICGNLLSWSSDGVAIAAEADPALVWPAVAEALYRIRKADRLFGHHTDLVLIKDLPHPDEPTERALFPHSYRPFVTEPNMVLRIAEPWQNFEDYLASLRRDYRKAIKNVDKQVRASGLTLSQLSPAEVRAEAAALHALYLNVQSSQRFRPITLPESYLPSLAEALGGDFVTSVLRDDCGKLAGFVTTLRDREGAVGYYIGYDKALAAQGVPVYLRLLHAVVADAISLRARWVSFGRTALEPKARLGAEPEALQCFVRHRIDPLNVIVRRLLELMPEPDLPPERNPFKAAEAG